MESFAAYSHALTALAFWAILISVLGALSTMGRTPEGRCDCGKPKRNYDDVVYRRERAFMNAIEASGPFLASTLAAVLLGAPVFWVNLFAALFVVVRVAMAVVHIGTTNQPMRSLFFMLGLSVFWPWRSWRFSQPSEARLKNDSFHPLIGQGAAQKDGSGHTGRVREDEADCSILYNGRGLGRLYRPRRPSGL